MKKNLLFLAFIFLGIISLPFDAQAIFKSTKVTLFVVDEGGTPLDGIDAGVAFEKSTGWGTDVTPQNLFTDGGGKATFSGQSNGHIAYGAENNKYYPSYYDYDFKKLGAFGWEPWNPELKVVMRKIENPVPMYARDTKGLTNGILIPEVKKELGFDLIEYDWVPPFGKGKVADFIFYLDSEFSGNRNYNFTLKIRTTKGNGFIKVIKNFKGGSEFKLSRLAPIDGYIDNLNLFARWKPERFFETSKNEENNYFFRVRANIVGNKVENAMYGKILRDFEVHPLPTGLARVDFKYYLNPDGTRNLEFDPNRNLFMNLPHRERVGIK